MRKTKPNTKKGLEEGGTGRLRCSQAKLSNFIRKKENPVRGYDDIRNNTFDLIMQR